MAEFIEWLQWFDSSGWLGLLGLAITLVGFGVTLLNVVRGRRAAEEAKEATKTAVAELQKLKAVTDLSAAVSELDGIRRLVRESSWHQVSERLSYVRKLLIGVAARHGKLPDNHKERILSAIQSFADAEKQIDSASRGKSRVNPDKMNKTLIDQIDDLVEILSGMI